MSVTEAGLSRRTAEDAIDNGVWSGYQKLALVYLALVFAVDGLANQSLGIAMPAIVADWGIAAAAMAPVPAANLTGVALGSIFGGVIGDRIGRRWALIVAILVFGIMTSAGALTENPMQLLAVRFVDGLGIGAAIPNGAALIAEITPRHRRGRAIAVAMVFIPIGGMVAGGIGASLLEVMGWQTVLAIAGLIPLLLGLVFIMVLPESPNFLQASGKQEQLRRLLNRCHVQIDGNEHFAARAANETYVAPIRTLLAPDLRRNTLLLWGGFFTCLMATYTLFSWVPTMMHTLGFDLTMSSIVITTFYFGSVIGALISGELLDRIGFRKTHLGYALFACAMAIALSAILSLQIYLVAVILPAMMALGFCMSGLHNTLYTQTASTYPTWARATGVGMASATGRLGAVLSSFTGVYTLELGGPLIFFGVVALLMALCGLAGWSVRTKTGEAWREPAGGSNVS